MQRLLSALAIALSCALSGCAVVTVASTVVGVAATGAGLAVDAAVGTVKLVGSGVSAVMPSSDPAK
jgi:hypothetical protein